MHWQHRPTDVYLPATIVAFGHKQSAIVSVHLFRGAIFLCIAFEPHEEQQPPDPEGLLVQDSGALPETRRGKLLC